MQILFSYCLGITVFELFKACEIKQIPYLDPNELPFKKDENDKRIVLEEAKDLLDKIKQITKEVLVGMYWYGGDYLQDKKMIVTIIINNLIAPIVQELHLVCPRNSEDKRMVTNILDVY